MAIINNLEELKQLLDLAKAYKVNVLKVDGIEMVIDNTEPLPQPKQEDEPTDEDLLFYSA